ncbi:MAG: hypothetical protein IT428_12085 [Planctomycetaceae bacterium]|nr:hypothetical protein [Planctomycetaceae bacterium]
MKTATFSVLIAGLCVLSGSVLSGQEGGGPQINKPTPPVLSTPETKDVKTTAPADIPVPAVPKDLPAEEPAAAETSETKAYNADDPASVKRHIDQLNQRVLTLEKMVDALKSQVHKNGELTAATLAEAAADIKKTGEGVKMLANRFGELETDLKTVRTELSKSKDDQLRLGMAVENTQKQIDTLNAEMGSVREDLKVVSGNLTDATRDLEIALSQVARWDDVAGKWVRVAGKATMTVNGKRQAAQFAPTTQGKLVIINSDPERERVLYINGTPWLTRVGRSYVLVPVGDVSISTSRDNPQFLRKWTMNDATGMMEARYEF